MDPLLPAPDVPDTVADDRLLDRVADNIVRRRLTTPAILMLESSKPMNFVGSQFLVFVDPLVRFFAAIPDYQRFTRMLADRGCIERLLLRIEAAEDRYRKAACK